MGGGEGENENEETTPVKATPQIEKGAGLGFVEDRNSKLDREVRRRKLLFQVEILLFYFLSLIHYGPYIIPIPFQFEDMLSGMSALTTGPKTPNSKAACRAAADEYENEKWEVKWKAKQKPPTTILTSKSPDEIGGRTVVNEPGKWAEVIVDSREEQESRKSVGLSFKVNRNYICFRL